MRSSIRARSAIGVAALLMAGPMTGCNVQQDSSEAIEAVGEPIPSSSSPSGPAAAKGSEVAAVATVRAWVAAYNGAVRTADSSAADALTGERCVTCNNLLASIDDVHRRGGYFRGGRWTIDAARVTQRASHSAKVTAGVTEAPGTTTASNTAEPDTYPQQRFILEVEVTRIADTSIVTEIVFLS